MFMQLTVLVCHTMLSKLVGFLARKTLQWRAFSNSVHPSYVTSRELVSPSLKATAFKTQQKEIVFS